MKLTTTFQGREIPFEGDRTLTLRGLPEGAQIQTATATVTPVALPGGTLFVETINFSNGQGSFGATKHRATGFVEVDFHARRTLAAVQGSNLIPNQPFGSQGANLQVDLGGLYVQINDQGAARSPGDTLFQLPADGLLPGLTVNKMKLTKSGENVNVSRATIRSVPTNVSLRLGTQSPFWTRLGEMTTPAVSSDFAPVLQAFLQTAVPENGAYSVPITLHSDALCRLDVTIDIGYVVEQPALPDGLAEATLPFDYSTVTDPLVEVELPVGARVVPGGTGGRVLGAFEGSRIIHRSTDVVAPATTVPVTPARSPAQWLKLAQTTGATAVDLQVTAVTRTATLSLNILADADGKPIGDPLLTRPATIQLDRELAAANPWISAPLPAEFQFEAGRAYWLVLQAVAGEAAWGVVPATAGGPALQSTADGGLSWRAATAAAAAGPLTAAFRLRHVPDKYQVPVDLQIGAGEEAQVVSLARFQPLGRVDFTLDFDEVANAFNQYVSKAGPAACPAAEHVANGDFDRWYRLGDNVGEDEEVPDTSGVTALVAAPNGQVVYLASLQGWLRTLDVGCRQIVAELPLEATDGSPEALAVHPAGNTLYLLSRRVAPASATFTWEYLLSLFEATTLSRIGAPVVLPREATGMAVGPDGRSLFIAEFRASTATGGGTQAAAIRVLDTGRLPQAAEGALPIDSPELSREIDLQLANTSLEPRGLALTTDGSLVYVVVQDTSSSELRSYDVGRGQQVGTPLDLFEPVIDFALSPDGRQVLVALIGESGGLQLIDLERRQSVWNGALDNPRAVALTRDGRRALAVGSPGEGEPQMWVIDLPARTVRTPINLSSFPHRLALTPQGDWAFVGYQEGLLTAVPFGEPLPSEWTLLSGHVAPVCLDEPFHQIALFGVLPDRERPSGSSATVLTQVMPAVGGCSYLFGFWGLASVSGAVAHLLWRGPGCDSQREDMVPLAVFEEEQRATRVTSVRTSSAARTPTRATRAEVPLVWHELRAEAPPGANQVEVRFTTPGNGLAAVDRVTLAGTNETLGNGRFRPGADAPVAGWTIEPAEASGLFITSESAGLALRNFSNESVRISQTSPATPETNYDLLVFGQVDDGPAPQAELSWQTADGAAIGAPVRQTFTPGADSQKLRGVAPATAANVAVTLVLPPGAALTVEQVQLQPLTTVKVPLSFLAQSPGELTLSDLRVAFEMVPPQPAPMPETGLCPPASPARGPRIGDDCCYCPCCEHERRMTDARAAVTEAGRPVTIGRCANCGAPLLRAGGVVEVGARNLSPVRLAERRIVATAMAPNMATRVPVDLFVREVVVLPPLTAVAGIAELRANQLGAVGIRTLDQLAAASPGLVASIRGISVRMAQEFIAEARRILAGR